MGRAKPRAWGSVRKRGDRPGYVVRFNLEGRTIERAAGRTWKEADKKRRAAQVLAEAGTPLTDLLAAVFGDVGGSGASLAELAPAYLAYAASRKKPTTLKGDTHRLGVLKAAPWSRKPLGAVTPRDLLAWTAKREASKVSGSTINRDLALGSALYKWAERAGHVTGDNPFRKVPRYSERGRARETYLTAAEARGLIDACSPILRPIVLAALHTGMRRGELLSLRWRSVDLKRAELVVEPEAEKAGRGRVVPLSPDLLTLLKALRGSRPRPAVDGSDHVFVVADGATWGLEALRVALRTTVKACEAIPVGKKERVTFHAMRHTAASLMVGAGVPVLDVARILGHSTLAVTMRYAHFAPESGRAAITELGRALNASGAG
ncbi:MAG: tyrosine-type recombinase/integrase [Planctomycetota bacterium]